MHRRNSQEVMNKNNHFTPRRPRIGLDLHVVDGIFQGSRTHCLELFSRVIATTPECDFIVLAASPQQLLDCSASFNLPHVNLVAMPYTSSVKRLLWQLPLLAKQHQLELLHTQYIVPPFVSCATAVTVHDILFESHPQFFDKLFVFRSRLLVRRSTRNSAEVFTVSDFSRSQITKNFGTKSEKVHTIFNGVDRNRFFPGQEGQKLIVNLNLRPGQYFLTVGRLEPRKNHSNLLRAWATLKRPRPRLVIVGQRHFGYHEALNLIRTLHLENDVVVLENVSDQELPAIYRNAKAFVYCSWAEGFGMPILEAMASGIPVISSATTALYEVADEAALLVQPKNIFEISNAISELDGKTDTRQELIRRGLSRIERFNWDHSAAIVREVYLKHFGFTRNGNTKQ